MRSFQVWLFYLIPLISIASLMATEVRVSLVATKDWRDVAVVGRGYVQTVDDDGENPIWFKELRLCINREGVLCADVDGKHRRIEPTVNVPSDWNSLAIGFDGAVTVSSSSFAGNEIGSIALGVFLGDDLEHASRLEDHERKMWAPIIDLPGRSGAGQIMQRNRFQHCLPLTMKTKICFFCLIIWVIGIPLTLKMTRS